MRGDVFRPTRITPAAIARLTTLAGSPQTAHPQPQTQEPPLYNPNASYPLPPDRGEDSDVPEVISHDLSADIIMADDLDPEDKMMIPPPDGSQSTLNIFEEGSDPMLNTSTSLIAVERSMGILLRPMCLMRR